MIDSQIYARVTTIGLYFAFPFSLIHFFSSVVGVKKSQLPQTDRATRCVTPIVLYTKVDAQSHELATVVSRTKLTTRCDGQLVS